MPKNNALIAVLFLFGIAGFIFVWRETEKETFLDLPTDEGVHDDLKSEWWFLRGQLDADSGQKFGLALIFPKKGKAILNVRNLETNESILYRDISSEDFSFSGNRLEIRSSDHYFVQKNTNTYELSFIFSDLEIKLELKSAKKPFLLRNDSEFYYQQTRIEAAGQVIFKGKSFSVKGLCWNEHQGFKDEFEWKSWRWLALQLDNNAEIMIFSDLATNNGLVKPKIYLYEGDNKTLLRPNQYSLGDEEFWASSGKKYATKSRLKIPEKGIDLEIKIKPDDQRIDGTAIYEGSGTVLGKYNKREIKGQALLEYR